MSYFGTFFACFNLGMYKNRLENDRNGFEIPALLSCKQGNSKYLCYFEFSNSGFSRSQDKRAGISKFNAVCTELSGRNSLLP